MRNTYLTITFLMISTLTFGQKLITKEGVIEIFSKTQLFTIEAKNSSVASIINLENGEVVASTLVRSFKFKEALVEEHFNENYMESHLYPKAVFSGKIEDFTKLDLTQNGTYPITISGKLTIHGQTNDLTTQGEISVKNNIITGKTSFTVSLQQYKIKIEESYKDRIKDDVKVDVTLNFKR